jgi:hypothetical protein
MSGVPKLKVTHWVDAQPSQLVIEFEQASYFLFNYDVIVVVEGEVIRSYDDLVKFASQDRFKDREYLEVQMETIVAGG